MRLSEFSKVTIDDGPDFREHFSRFVPEHSDYLHSIMVSWSHYMDYRYLWKNGSLIILTEHEGIRRLRPPVGEFDPDLFTETMELAREKDMEHVLSMVGIRTKEAMLDRFSNLEFIPHRNYFDYVYQASDLAELPGKGYLKVRNYLNKFRRENDYSMESIGDNNIEDVKEFLRRWCMQKGCNDDPFLITERQATMTSLENLTDLALSGSAIRIGDRIEALSIFEEMAPDMAVIHYEKANFDIWGLYQAINNEAAIILSEKYDFINRESDMGVPGLRKAKMKYRPHHMLEVFHTVIA
jgi:hypothetical protein